MQQPQQFLLWASLESESNCHAKQRACRYGINRLISRTQQNLLEHHNYMAGQTGASNFSPTIGMLQTFTGLSPTLQNAHVLTRPPECWLLPVPLAVEQTDEKCQAVQMVQISSDYITAEGRRVHIAPGQNCKLILLDPYKCELLMIIFPDWDRKEQIFFPERWLHPKILGLYESALVNVPHLAQQLQRDTNWGKPAAIFPGWTCLSGVQTSELNIDTMRRKIPQEYFYLWR